MLFSQRTIAWLFVAAFIHSGLADLATAQVSGFSFPEWKLNQSDDATRPQVDPPTSVRITGVTGGEARSLFFEEKQDISQFEASFEYAFSGDNPSGMGAAFVIQNDALTRVGLHPAGFGYTREFARNTMAVSLEGFSLFEGSSSTGVYTGGGIGGGSQSTNPVNLFSGNPIDVTINYDGIFLRLTATDSVTGDSYTTPKVVIDIPAEVGGTQAWIGFTAATNFIVDTTQTLSNFRFGPTTQLGGCNGDELLNVFDADCTSSGDLPTLLSQLGLQLGDADGNGEVGFSDFLVLSQNFRSIDALYTQGDFDKSGDVGLPDFVILLNHLETGPGGALHVPEANSSWTIWAVLLASRIRSRRRSTIN